ncbi:hypothetical protein Tco_0290087 [Tanacetum coccineum]
MENFSSNDPPPCRGGRQSPLPDISLDSDILRHDQKCKNMKHSQDMQLIQKLRNDQKRMKKVFEVMSGRNIVTNSRVTPSWREIVSLTFSEAGVLHVNWTSFGHCVMDVMTMKMNAQYKEFQSCLKPNPDHNDDDIPMLREEEAKFMQTFCCTRFYNDYRDRVSNRDNWRSSGRNNYNRDNYQSHFDDKPYLQKQLSDFIKAQHLTNSFVKDTFMDLKTKLKRTTKNHQVSIQNLEAKFDRFADKQSGQPSRSLSSNTLPNLKGSSSKPYQPPQAQNEHVNVVFTRCGKSYDPPLNPNDQQNNSEAPINFNSDEEDDEPTP